jgi:hypothetical protein
LYNEKIDNTSNIGAFFTPCQVTDGGKLKAFITPVNHNNLLEDMIIDICNTMMGDYCGSDNLHMQEMGDDAGVIVRWDEGIEVSFLYNNCIQVIQILKIMAKVALLYLDKKSNDNAAILLPMNPQQKQ